ncbi:hypothetical protein BV898_06573 [Hypsibius exemplaris]|uniref:Uncharacterized protein n=1 Tax=Hypsibius exemplaris TaxID=2072580 RepID=A0A1W0WVU5_HYPEX|nr:hypothetical protein BV898_06573 [Hypsibius exemplaris]
MMNSGISSEFRIQTANQRTKVEDLYQFEESESRARNVRRKGVCFKTDRRDRCQHKALCREIAELFVQGYVAGISDQTDRTGPKTRNSPADYFQHHTALSSSRARFVNYIRRVTRRVPANVARYFPVGSWVVLAARDHVCNSFLATLVWFVSLRLEAFLVLRDCGYGRLALGVPCSSPTLRPRPGRRDAPTKVFLVETFMREVGQPFTARTVFFSMVALPSSVSVCGRPGDPAPRLWGFSLPTPCCDRILAIGLYLCRAPDLGADIPLAAGGHQDPAIPTTGAVGPYIFKHFMGFAQLRNGEEYLQKIAEYQT